MGGEVKISVDDFEEIREKGKALDTLCNSGFIYTFYDMKRMNYVCITKDEGIKKMSELIEKKENEIIELQEEINRLNKVKTSKKKFIFF